MPGAAPGYADTDRAARVAAGKTARERTPLEALSSVRPQQDRPDPVVLLEHQAATREPALVPIRYGRMLASPFAFFRGAPLVMAADLAASPHSGLRVQLCGDAHLANFGVFASPERHLVFDINDFDETLPGPFEWDVRRLAASLEVAASDNDAAAADRRKITLAAAREYRLAMQQFATMPTLDVWYAHVDVDAQMPTLLAPLNPKPARRTERQLAKVRTHDSLQAFRKLTEQVDGEVRIVNRPPLIVPVRELISDDEAAALVGGFREVIGAYARTLQSDRRHLLEQFRVVDMAHKVVGVGSVGTRTWIVLLEGLHDREPLFLQVKEAQLSVLEGLRSASRHRNQGARVVAGQHLMQASSDIFLGWVRATELDGVPRDYYVRQLRDWKGSAPPQKMRPPDMTAYARLCGWTLARAHARSGDRVAIAAYLGKKDVFDRAIADFAAAYAEVTSTDYAALQAAAASGRIVAATDK
jgi:uncharacterized protein (DUF2252 family)